MRIAAKYYAQLMAQNFAMLVRAVSVFDSRTDFSDTFTVIDPDAASLPLADTGVQRGDGIFETIGVFNQQPLQLSEHLERLESSAKLLDLPTPNLLQWDEAVQKTLPHLPMGESMIKLALNRPNTPDAAPTAWLFASAIADFSVARSAGISVVTLNRGLASDAAEQAPWLLLGAKTLSYATNMAALREAARRGAEDAIFISTDGFALEGPTSSLLLRFGDEFVTPAPQTGILHGTTQLVAFEFLRGAGFQANYRKVLADELRQADAAWLLSSVRQASPIRLLDGAELPVDSGLTAALNNYLLSPGS